MKRSNKLSLKTETLRQLDTAQLSAVNGGALAVKSTECVQLTGSGNPQSTELYPIRWDAGLQMYVRG
ncbi:MAG TPA: class I lanthipeptide [Kofleriaceae bacterium]